MNLDQLAHELRQEVLTRCVNDDAGQFGEDAFTEVMIEYLTQAGEVDDGEVCFHKHTSRGEKLNAFALSGDGECADLFVSKYHGNGANPPVSVPRADVVTHFRWLTRFFESALGGIHKEMEESSPIFGVAQQICVSKNDLSRARFFMLTDGLAKFPEMPKTSVGGIEVQHVLWDIEKLRRFISSNMKRETIVVDFTQFGGVIPCLEAPESSDEYRTFLAFFPGNALARLYGQYGPRLLEKNVRSFLQAKGKINKGIRKTILEEPQRFLAYNNGLSATAQAVDFDRGAGGVPLLREARDFQVVNGGQTTASIYHALKRDKADLSALTVQVKLTVLKDARSVDEFVPLISQYANSQNKVNAADFSANHPYHVALEELSRRVWAPPLSGTDRQTHWYYERARGSYLDDKSREATPAKMRAFEAMNPLRQKFTKTDLAKFENTWDQFPHVVSLGAEKNFVRFTSARVEDGYPQVDEDYFHRLVAKALLFRTAERIVGRLGYGGFRAQIVTYSLSWLSHRTAHGINLGRIWQDQAVQEPLSEAIRIVSKYAYEHIVNPPANRKNPGEWCKRQECWDAFREVEIHLPPAVKSELISGAQVRDRGRRADAKTAEVSPESQAAIARVSDVPSDVWFQISHWAKETQNLQGWQRAIAFSLGRLAGRGAQPSPKQALQGVKILDEVERLGFKRS